MSELITNLQTIYNTKLAIKQAIGTDSDNFVDYPSYISGMVTPTGYSYITTNGDFDISTYEMVNVNVSGGGVEYTWIDWGTSPVLTQGDKVSFNGYLGNAQQITQEIVSSIPALADYLGWYIYPVGGWINDGEHNPWEKYVLSENQLTIATNSGVVVYGEIIDINMGSIQKMTILEDINETKYAGGNGTLNITSNGTQQVARYQSVSVNVPDSEFNPSKLTDDPDDTFFAYLRITNTTTNETIYYQLYPIDDNYICTTIVRLSDIINYRFPGITTDNIIINLIEMGNTWYYNDTVGGALYESNFVSPLLLQVGTSTDSFITDLIPDHLCIGIDRQNTNYYIWNGDNVYQQSSSASSE